MKFYSSSLCFLLCICALFLSGQSNIDSLLRTIDNPNVEGYNEHLLSMGCDSLVPFIKSKHLNSKAINLFIKSLLADSAVCQKQIIENLTFLGHIVPIPDGAIGHSYETFPIWYAVMSDTSSATAIRKYLIDSDYLADCDYIYNKRPSLRNNAIWHNEARLKNTIYINPEAPMADHQTEFRYLAFLLRAGNINLDKIRNKHRDNSDKCKMPNIAYLIEVGKYYYVAR